MKQIILVLLGPGVISSAKAIETARSIDLSFGFVATVGSRMLQSSVQVARQLMAIT
jgi:hypothetical protein